MPPAYVKPCVKRGKTDAADAETICEAVTRPTMRVTPQACPRHDAATTPDVVVLRSARDYAAWLGLTPRAHSSGGKARLGRIGKVGGERVLDMLERAARERVHNLSAALLPEVLRPGTARARA